MKGQMDLTQTVAWPSDRVLGDPKKQAAITSTQIVVKLVFFVKLQYYYHFVLDILWVT